MKELLFSVTKKDFELQFFRAGGKGGQKQNKTSSACRIVHKASGATGESREQRQQIANKKLAFQRLIKESGVNESPKSEDFGLARKETKEITKQTDTDRIKTRLSSGEIDLITFDEIEKRIK